MRLSVLLLLRIPGFKKALIAYLRIVSLFRLLVVHPHANTTSPHKVVSHHVTIQATLIIANRERSSA